MFSKKIVKIVVLFLTKSNYLRFLNVGLVEILSTLTIIVGLDNSGSSFGLAA